MSTSNPSAIVTPGPRAEVPWCHAHGPEHNSPTRGGTRFSEARPLSFKDISASSIRSTAVKPPKAALGALAERADAGWDALVGGFSLRPMADGGGPLAGQSDEANGRGRLVECEGRQYTVLVLDRPGETTMVPPRAGHLATIVRLATIGGPAQADAFNMATAMAHGLPCHGTTISIAPPSRVRWTNPAPVAGYGSTRSSREPGLRRRPGHHVGGRRAHARDNDRHPGALSPVTG